MINTDCVYLKKKRENTLLLLYFFALLCEVTFPDDL